MVNTSATYKADQAIGSLRNQEASADIAKTLLAALGIGAAARGTLGLGRLWHTNVVQPERKHDAVIAPLAVYRPTEDREDDEMKTAGFLVSAEDKAKVSIPWYLRDNVQANTQRGGSFLGGSYAKSKAGISWYLPGLLMAGVAGLPAGWVAADKLLDARRTQERQDEIEKARAEFEAVLTPRASKLAADSSAAELSRLLDAEFDRLEATEKTAEEPYAPSTLGDLGGRAVGMYGGYGILSAALASLLGYQIAKGSNKSTVINKAINRRRRAKNEARPQEIYAIPYSPDEEPPR